MRKTLFCLLLSSAFAVHAETLTGKVIGVADGDTINVPDADKVQRQSL